MQSCRGSQITLRVWFSAFDLVGANQHWRDGKTSELEAEFGDGASARRDDGPRALGQALQNLAGPLDFIDALGRHRLTRFQERRLRLDAELGSDQSNSFSCGPAVCERDHGVGIERMARCPSTPRALDAFRGIDEDAIQ